MNCKRLTVHNKGVGFKVNPEKCHGICFVVKGYQEFVSGEDFRILRVFTGDGKNEILLKLTCLFVHIVNGNRVFTRNRG